MAADTNWFYAHGGKQAGPVKEAELQAMLSRGQVLPSDMVWCNGMSQWRAAREIAEFAGSTGLSGAPAAVVGYYDGAGMPPRAVQNLNGHAHPTGDTGTWPLDDASIQQFQEAVKLRKRVTGAAQVYRLLLILSGIGLAVLIPVFFFAVSNLRARQAFSGDTIALSIVLGTAILYYFADRATRRSQRWAPLTMFIVFVASFVLQIASIAMQALTAPNVDTRPAIAGACITFFFTSIFALISWRAFAAIPKYLRQPAWAQELIVKAGL